MACDARHISRRFISRDARLESHAAARDGKWAARRLDTVWVLSDDDRDGLQAAAPRATVRKFPGFGVGCDLEKFAPVSAAERAAIRTQFGIAREHVAFAFLGRFVRFQRVRRRRQRVFGAL